MLCPLDNDFPFLQSEGCPSPITGKSAPVPLHPPKSQLSLIPHKAQFDFSKAQFDFYFLGHSSLYYLNLFKFLKHSPGFVQTVVFNVYTQTQNLTLHLDSTYHVRC